MIPIATIILAAGKGTRMKSPKAKVLHHVFFEPMLHHVLRAVAPLQAERSIVIVGHQKEAVEAVLTSFAVNCVEQKEQKGTGHAVLCAEQALADFNGNVMILCGDTPLLQYQHLQQMITAHENGNTPLTIMTTRLADPTNYGRIISDHSGNVTAVVEEKDATEQQRLITEINAGIYCVEKRFLFDAVKRITTNNAQGEMYVTDIVGIAVSDNYRVQTYEHPCPGHVLGVNSRSELAQAHREIQARRNEALLADGISMHHPPTISIAPTAVIGQNTILAQNITISGNSQIGKNCTIDQGVSITNARIGNDVMIGANSVILNSTIASNTIIEPGTIIKTEIPESDSRDPSLRKDPDLPGVV